TVSACPSLSFSMRPVTMPRVDADLKLDFKDVLFRPKRSSLSIIAEQLNSKSTFSIYINFIYVFHGTTATSLCSVFQHTLFTAIQKHYSLEEWKTFAASHPECLEHVAASSGSGAADLEKLCSILEAIPLIQYICLDVGMVEELILSGADIIKVGIGPGSVCTTHIKTGVGYPQMSAVIECADSAHGLKGHIISVLPEADFVMLGGMSAGHDQCAGEIIEKDGKKFKLFYEMSSDTAMKKYVGGVAEYRASEGRTVQVPYKGDVENTIRDIFGGLRSTCTYVGAAKLKELSRRTTFIRVTQQYCFAQEPC
uniref:GMP reductase n=1 Tax=Cyprinus carpio TaxID=7962 RepID=A0A8C1KPS2_CYPCA